MGSEWAVPPGGRIDFGNVGDLTGSVFADRALATLAGAAIGYGIDRLVGGNGTAGAAIGGGVGLGMTFVPPFDISFGNITKAAIVADRLISGGMSTARIKSAIEVPTLTVLQEGIRRSKTFKDLMSKAGIALTNYKQIILRGSGTGILNVKTSDNRPKIQLDNTDGIDDLITGAAHEFTNRVNGAKFDKLYEEVAYGDITPEEYAEKMIETETEAIANQIIFASEASIDFPNNHLQNKLRDDYKAGKITKDGIITELSKHVRSSKITSGPNKGRTALEKYREDGEKIRKTE